MTDQWCIRCISTADEEKENPARIVAVLYKVFATDPCIAYKQFVAKTLQPGKTVDIYLAVMKMLATWWITCMCVLSRVPG